MRHEDFHKAAASEAMGAIEEAVLPALARLIATAAAAEPGVNAAASADELRMLARDIELLQALLSPPRG